jgi:hypothetical protein
MRLQVYAQKKVVNPENPNFQDSLEFLAKFKSPCLANDFVQYYVKEFRPVGIFQIGYEEEEDD